jgi:L-cysteate sulfo-lyase
MTTELLQEKLTSFAKFQLLDGPTPIQELKNLNQLLGGVKVYLKRDDLTGVALGGNKLRKLEYLIGDAIKQGANHIITMGARQSNHARLTAAAAAKANLSCDLLLTRTVPIDGVDYNDNGNLILDHILGANIIDLPRSSDAHSIAQERAQKLRTSGKTPYIIPTGGSNEIGCLGYLNCFYELLVQVKNMDLDIDSIVVPNASSGTHAGLLAGAITSGSSIKIKGYNVMAEPETTIQATLNRTKEVLNLLGPSTDDIVNRIDINHNYRGEAYGIPTSEMLEALTTLARSEGIILDPVYSGKAFAGLLGDIKKGIIEPGTNVVFVATGGSPALFAYRSTFDNLGID